MRIFSERWRFVSVKRRICFHNDLQSTEPSIEERTIQIILPPFIHNELMIYPTQKKNNDTCNPVSSWCINGDFIYASRSSPFFCFWANSRTLVTYVRNFPCGQTVIDGMSNLYRDGLTWPCTVQLATWLLTLIVYSC